MEQFLANFAVQKGTDSKPITHTSMKCGKWHIPKQDLPKFYELVTEAAASDSLKNPIVEKMNDIFPFVIDIDLKYKTKIEERQYTDNTIE